MIINSMQKLNVTSCIWNCAMKRCTESESFIHFKRWHGSLGNSAMKSCTEMPKCIAITKRITERRIKTRNASNGVRTLFVSIGHNRPLIWQFDSMFSSGQECTLLCGTLRTAGVCSLNCNGWHGKTLHAKNKAWENGYHNLRRPLSVHCHSLWRKAQNLNKVNVRDCSDQVNEVYNLLVPKNKWWH
jgi:hypothetical protein